MDNSFTVIGRSIFNTFKSKSLSGSSIFSTFGAAGATSTAGIASFGFTAFTFSFFFAGSFASGLTDALALAVPLALTGAFFFLPFASFFAPFVAVFVVFVPLAKFFGISSFFTRIAVSSSRELAAPLTSILRARSFAISSLLVSFNSFANLFTRTAILFFPFPYERRP